MPYPRYYTCSGCSSPASLLGSRHCWKQLLPFTLLAQLLPHQQLFASQLWCQRGKRNCRISFVERFADQFRWHAGSRAGSWRYLGELIIWSLKRDNECSTHAFILSLSVNASSSASLLTQSTPTASACSVISHTCTIYFHRPFFCLI